MSYQPKVYREQGGDRLVVASSGDVRVESGGTLTNKGSIVNSSGGTIRESIAVPALGATLPNYGISSVGSSASTSSYKLGAPVAGAMKTIVATATIGGNATVTSTAATVGSTQGSIVLAEAGGAIHLVGLSASRWSVIGMSTGASIS